MSPEDEAAALKKENALLMQEKADAVTLWHNEVRLSLKSLTSEVAAIKLNTNEMPQLRANQESLGVRVRYLEDFKILIVCAFIVVIMVFGIYIEWRLGR